MHSYALQARNVAVGVVDRLVVLILGDIHVLHVVWAVIVVATASENTCKTVAHSSQYPGAFKSLI